MNVSAAAAKAAARAAVVGAALALLAACATAPPLSAPPSLFHDELFGAPSVPIDPASALAISPAMRTYLAGQLADHPHVTDRRRWLIDALYHRGSLRLEYDAETTRTAAEAFDARMGNCLSLVLMTAAFANELGLPVHFQAVLGDAQWDRSNDMLVAVGHVNVALDDRAPPTPGTRAYGGDSLVVDFLPSPDAERLRTRSVDTRGVVAMYLNNRAVESLAAGRTTDAYWWTRAAVAEDPTRVGAYVTLGVVYLGLHRPDLAEQALAPVLAREPENVDALSNRVRVMRELGRGAEADALAARVAQLDRHPPFADFDAGVAAYRAGRFETARELLEREAARTPHSHEIQFWLAAICSQLGRLQEAREHLVLAMQASTSRRDRDLYAGKLDRLKALGLQ